MTRRTKLVLPLLVAAILLLAGSIVFYLYPLGVADQFTRSVLWIKGVKSEYANVAGYRLHYFEARPAHGDSGKTLLLVHGLGGRSEDWAGLIPAMTAAGFHVYAPDLLGYGRSDRPDVSYSISMQEDVLAKFMQAVHLEHADVAGWSMGGWVSMKLALDHPQRVDRLVLYDSAGIYFPPTFDPDLFTPRDREEVARLLAVLTPRARHMPGFVSDALIRRQSRNAWVIHRSAVAMMTGSDLLDFRLNDLKQPTLVVWGSRDDLIPLLVGKRIDALIPNASLMVIDGCGHMAPVECWRPVAKGTIDFLKQESTANN
ncbi:MAG: alpha/beta hydrolase [Acidobacteriaceae bacterium]|nr:alpha/beta hydrolase [Acidobacteriaceae bacterium]